MMTPGFSQATIHIVAGKELRNKKENFNVA